MHCPGCIALSSIVTAAAVCMQLFGHVHADERTKPLKNYQVDACGPMHITIGDGGNIEVSIRHMHGT
jgi:hypothetical protein